MKSFKTILSEPAKPQTVDQLADVIRRNGYDISTKDAEILGKLAILIVTGVLQ